MAGFPTIDEQTATSRDVVRAVRDGKILLVDCRPKNEFSEGVIRSTNWVNIPHYEIRKWIKSTSDKEFEEEFNMMKPNVEDEIICYCREGRRAQDATMSFLELGFRNAKNYFGGVNSWIKEKRPVEHT